MGSVTLTGRHRDTVTVAIASVGRPHTLRNSIEHVLAQTDPADTVIVVAQRMDIDTQSVASSFGLHVVIVDRPGLALALQTAIAATTTDIVAFVDDDAEALPDWVHKIRTAFSSDPALGLLGGRDNVDGDRLTGSEDLVVGALKRGKLLGNHHLGRGNARETQHVKGANMSMRVAPAKRIPLELLVAGTGAQARNEFVLSLGIVSQGFHAVYDPTIQVDHFPAVRAIGDERTKFDRSRTRVVRENESLAIALYRSRVELLAFIIRAVLIGDHTCYGLLYLAVKAISGDRSAYDRFAGSMEGLLAGLRRSRQLRNRRYSKEDH